MLTCIELQNLISKGKKLFDYKFSVLNASDGAMLLGKLGLQLFKACYSPETPLGLQYHFPQTRQVYFFINNLRENTL